MAETTETPETESTGEPEVGTISPSAAMAIGIRKGRAGEKPDAEFDAFLREQTRFLRLQSEHLLEQRTLQIENLTDQARHLRLRHFNERLTVALKLMSMALGAIVLVWLGAMAWSAHEDHGVAIEAFSVPPEFAARGMTGQVAASQLLDRLARLQAQTLTGRPASSYANDWGGDIKVEIPETGVSIGELNRYLRQWLGNQTRISGELVRTPAGLAVTARVGASAGRRFEGSEAEVDRLIDQAAEAVYQQTQPYRYAVYLSTRDPSRAIAAFSWLAGHGSREDRAWAYAGWATTLARQSLLHDARLKAQAAIALDPRIRPAYPILELVEGYLGHQEKALDACRADARLLESGHALGIAADDREPVLRFIRDVCIPGALGAYHQAAQAALGRADIVLEGGQIAWGLSAVKFAYLSVLAGEHDFRAAIEAAPSGATRVFWQAAEAQDEDDWQAALPLTQKRAEAAPRDFITTTGWPDIANVYIHVGRLAEAEALVVRTPLDCTPCLWARGLLAETRGEHRTADRWMAETVRSAPSLPLYDAAWGRMLLERGDVDGAIEKLRSAHRKGPRFADALELWGEALLQKGDWAGAAAKFAEADTDAPRWGRNHLRWGEALLRLGRYREARAQFQTAGGLDLGRSDRAALNVFLDRTAKRPLQG